MFGTKQSNCEIIYLSSDSDVEELPPKNFSGLLPSKPKSPSAVDIPTKDDPRLSNSLVKQRISVLKSGTVRVVTDVNPHHITDRVDAGSSDTALREFPATKFSNSIKRKPKASINNDSNTLKRIKLTKVKRVENDIPPWGAYTPQILKSELSKLSSVNNNPCVSGPLKVNLQRRSSVENPIACSTSSNVEDTAASRVKQSEYDTDESTTSIFILDSDSFNPNNQQLQTPNKICASAVNDDPRIENPSKEKTPLKSDCVSIIDVPDVKILMDTYKNMAKDVSDVKAVERVRKKLARIKPDSVNFDNIFREFVFSVRRKLVNDPMQAHVFMHEFLEEVKNYKISKNVVNQVADVEATPSTSKAILSTSQPVTLSAPSKVTILERKMKTVMLKLDELNAKELSIEEMDDDSSFVQSGQLEKKLMEMWNCYCKLVNRDTETSRNIDRPFKFQGSRYKEINKAVSHLVKKIKPKLPDFSDIFEIVTVCNNKFSYHQNNSNLKELASEILNVVGSELKQRRVYDLEESLETWMQFQRSKDIPILPDPAKTDPVLKAKLDESKQQGRQKMEELLKHFTQKQDEFARENPEKHQKVVDHGEDESSCEDDETESEFDKNIFFKEDSHEDSKDLVQDERSVDELPSLSSSDSEKVESSESSDSEADLEMIRLPKIEKEPNRLDMNMVSVEGVGHLYYGNGNENFSRFHHGEDSSDSDVITLD